MLGGCDLFMSLREAARAVGSTENQEARTTKNVKKPPGEKGRKCRKLNHFYLKMATKALEPASTTPARSVKC